MGVTFLTNEDKTELEQRFDNVYTKEEVDALKGKVYVSIPPIVHLKVGEEFKLYFRNVVARDDVKFWVQPIYNNNLTVRYYDEYISFIATAEIRITATWKLYDDVDSVLDSGSFSLQATSNVAEDMTVLVIGDSTVNAGTMTQKTLDLFSGDNATLTLLGTRGTSPNLHEGRGGWTAKGYCTKSSDETYGVNPFYNNGFDFSYYMTNQGYTDIDCVVLQLGINDIFSFKEDNYNSSDVLSYFQQIVNSILSYDSTIKIIINLPTTPNSNGTSFTETYGISQLYWVYNRNIIRFAKELSDYFSSNENITISASNCILDTKTHIRDGVHPTTDGYNELGKRLYETLVNIYIADVESLIDVSTRTFEELDSFVGSTYTRDLNATSIYRTDFGGMRGLGFNTTVNISNTTQDSFTLITSTFTGGGVEFPVPQLEVGKTYKVHYKINVDGLRMYLMRYNADTTYFDNTLKTSNKGIYDVTFTVEEGYIYSIQFASCPGFPGEGVVSDFTLVEVI